MKGLRFGIAGIVLASSFVSGCAGGKPTSAETTEEPTPDAVETTETPAVELRHSASFVGASNDGYKGTVTINQGDLQHAELGMVNGDVTLGASCDVNPSTDAVVPFSITVENNTPGVDAQLSAGWSLERPGWLNEPVTVVPIQQELGDECKAERATNAVVTSASGTEYGFILVRNYWPPNGKVNTEPIRHAVMVVRGIGREGAAPGNGLSIKSAHGTGIALGGDYDGTYGVPLDPANQKKGCLDARVEDKIPCPY